MPQLEFPVTVSSSSKLSKNPVPANGPHYIATLTSRPFISVMSVFPGQTSEDLAKKSGPICSCDITIYVSTGHNPHYTDLT